MVLQSILELPKERCECESLFHESVGEEIIQYLIETEFASNDYNYVYIFGWVWQNDDDETVIINYCVRQFQLRFICACSIYYEALYHRD